MHPFFIAMFYKKTSGGFTATACKTHYNNI